MQSSRFSLRPLKQSGFTLIELLISLTLMALLMVVLYQAFAVASRVWSRQDLADTALSRQIALQRLLQQDLDQLQTYQYRHEKGEYVFFLATSRALFYVTRQGYGAHFRQGHGLFFACFYLRVNPDGSETLRLYKTPWPEQALLDAFEAYIQLDAQQQNQWQPPETIEKAAVDVIDDLQAALFRFNPPAQSLYLESEEHLAPSLVALPWQMERRVPQMLVFSWQQQDRWHHHHLRPNSQPDPLRPPDAEDAGGGS